MMSKLLLSVTAVAVILAQFTYASNETDPSQLRELDSEGLVLPNPNKAIVDRFFPNGPLTLHSSKFSVPTVPPVESPVGVETEKPLRCLAFSGGGIRSALFSIGVLKALGETNELYNFNVISSVSGGGYAAGWFYAGMHRLRLSRSNLPEIKEMFTPAELRRVAVSIKDEYYENEVVRNAADGLYGLTSIGFAVPFLPLDVLKGSPGLKGESYAAIQYRTRLERAFLGATKSQSLLTFLGTKATPTLKELWETVRQLNLPVFVFNATVHGASTATPLSDLIFNFTSVNYGSKYTGFSDVDDDYTIGDAIAISGAALDMPLANPVAGTLRNYSGVTLGRSIPAIRGDDKTSSYWLSDGGHIDNLGAFTLLKYGCSPIFIVDAEEDPEYRFNGYRKLKDLAKRYLNRDVHIPEIDEFVNANSKQARTFRFPLNLAPPVTVGWVDAPKSAYSEVKSAARIIYIKLAYNPQWFPESHFLKTQPQREFPHYPTLNQYGISEDGMIGLITLGAASADVALLAERDYDVGLKEISKILNDENYLLSILRKAQQKNK
jgi:hypothetical protein